MKTNKGFSLIEVLVTLVLTAVGVLGMFVLQSRSISYTQDTVQREQAITAVNDLVELIRVHRDDMYENVPSHGKKQKGTNEDYYSKLKSVTELYSGLNIRITKPENGCASNLNSLKNRAECWWHNNSLVLPDFRLENVCPTSDGENCTSNYAGNNLLVRVRWEGRDEMCATEINNPDGTTSEAQICRYSVMVEL